MANISNIKELAKKLNLYNIASGKINLRNEKMTNTDYIEDIFLQEVTLRNKNHIKLLKKDSHLPKKSFDMAKVEKSISWTIQKLMKLDFIEKQENIFILGDCVKGKTSLSVKICSEAINQGYKVIYLLFNDYMDIIKNFDANQKCKKAYKYIKNCDIIVIDDFLYLDISDRDLNILYNSLLFFNESRTLILISNRKMDEFKDVAKNQHLIKTLIDRLNNNSHIIYL